MSGAIGQLPDGWRLMRMKWIAAIRFSNVNKHSLPDELPVRLCNYVDVYKNEVITPALEFMEATATPSEIERFTLQRGDVLMTKDSESPDDIGVPAVVKETAPHLVCGYHLAMLRPIDGVMDGAFLMRCLQADGVKQQFHVAANGVTRFGLGQGDIGTAQVPVPGVETQRTVAAFLDRRTATLDALLAKKERLIERLREKRQALITEAVTRGLDPRAPTKDSGVPWLGQIPAHWTMTRLKRACDVRTGIAKGRESKGTMVARPYLRVANVQDGFLRLDDVATIEVTEEEAARYRLQRGDVLMNEGGDFDKLGRGYVWEGQVEGCLHQNHVFAVRPRRGVDPYWVNIVTQSEPLKHYFMSRSKQSTNLASISSTNLGEAPIPLPPIDEARAIVEALRRKLTRVEQASERITTQIARLREYRQALITEAVTGKIPLSRMEAAVAAGGAS